MSIAIVTLALAACGNGAGSNTTIGPMIVISGTAHAGPICPVVTDPPEPACADRPVAGAVLVVTDSGGTEIARTSTAQDGSFEMSIAVDRDYVLVALPVEGLLGTPPPIAFSAAGEDVSLDVAYDTGIR